MTGAALVGALALGLAACAPDPATESYLNGENKGYVSVDLTVTEFAPGERSEPVDFGGVTEDARRGVSLVTCGNVVALLTGAALHPRYFVRG